MAELDSEQKMFNFYYIHPTLQLSLRLRSFVRVRLIRAGRLAKIKLLLLPGSAKHQTGKLKGQGVTMLTTLLQFVTAKREPRNWEPS